MATKKIIPKKVAVKKAVAKKIIPQKTAVKKAVAKKTIVAKPEQPKGKAMVPPFQELLLRSMNTKLTRNPKPMKIEELERRLDEYNIRSKIDIKKTLNAVNMINPEGFIPVEKMPEDIKKSIQTLKPETKRTSGDFTFADLVIFAGVTQP